MQTEWCAESPEPAECEGTEWYMELPGPIDPPPRKRRKLPSWVLEISLYGRDALPDDHYSTILHQFWVWDIRLSLYPAAVAAGGLWRSPKVLQEWLKRVDLCEWYKVVQY